MKKRIGILILTAIMTLSLMVPETVQAKGGIVNTSDKKYSYGDMKKDLNQLAKKYPRYASLLVLGKTADNRKIYCMAIGNQKAKKQVVIQSSMHAREYLNTQVIMKSMENYLSNYKKGSYKGVSYKKMFQEVCVYVIPMENPDGVSISQYGAKAIRNATLRKKVKKMLKHQSYRAWKANARGVDLNRNWPRWSKNKMKTSKKKPSSAGYSGKKPLSENETVALYDFINGLDNVKAVVSYHSTGSLLYWNIGQRGSVKRRCKTLLRTIKGMNHYRAMSSSKVPNSFGEWCIGVKGITQITVETGSGICPLSHSEFKRIYAKNKTVIGRVARLYI